MKKDKMQTNMVEITQCLNWKKPEAKVFAWLVANPDGGDARDIEHDLRLAQPAVSNGTRTLEEKGYIDVTNIKKENNAKGRPKKFYKIKKNAIKKLENEIKTKLDKEQELLERLQV